MVHTPTRMQHALLASLDRDTKLAVARAYRARRQLGESNHPAVQAALEAFRAVVLIIARALQQVPEWFWRVGRARAAVRQGELVDHKTGAPLKGLPAGWYQPTAFAANSTNPPGEKVLFLSRLRAVEISPSQGPPASAGCAYCPIGGDLRASRKFGRPGGSSSSASSVLLTSVATQTGSCSRGSAPGPTIGTEAVEVG
jgi:hypothetical protein